MTEKRFKVFTGNNYGVQTVDGEVFIDSILSVGDADVLVDLLNEQHETIQRLEAQLSHIEYRFTEYRNKTLKEIKEMEISD